MTLWRALLANLRGGVRAAFFRRVRRTALVASPEQLILVSLLTIVAGLALNRSFFHGTVAFNWSELRTLWFELPLFLFVGWICARFTRKPVDALAVAIVLYAAALSVNILLSVLLHVAQAIVPQHQVRGVWLALYYGDFIWLVLMAAVLVKRSLRLSAHRALLVVLPLIAFALYDVYFPPADMWYEMPEQATEQGVEPVKDSAVSEEMLELQPRLLTQTLQQLLPQRPEATDLYFVGFAPFGYQDVFLKESEVIRQLMDERFGTRGRSLLLANNNKALRRYPLASVTNLRKAMARVSQLIDRERDVVVLYLTSHGSDKHKLSADYWPLRLDALDPPSLKKILDDAGIKWRVIIVSACYAGGFIEPLRGPTTLVMTAADAKHTSFGCGAESEFTYFAKALFDEQLRQTYSFEEAFQRAVPVIRERETAQREEFSNPQIAMGEAMRAKLREVERALQTTKH